MPTWRSHTVPCVTCGADAAAQPGDEPGQARYCSRTCYHAAQRTCPAPASQTCEYCNAAFTPHRGNRSSARYCSITCYRTASHRDGTVEATCPSCGNPFRVHRSRAARPERGRAYCPACSRKGRPRIERVEVMCAGDCGLTIIRTSSQIENSATGRFFCGAACRNRVGAKPRRQPPRTCVTCQAEFYPNSGASVGRFCSTKCHNTWQRRNRQDRSCAACGAVFSVPPSSPTRYCSAPCYTAHRATPVGSRRVDGAGYVLIYRPDHIEARRGTDEDGWALEHRMLMSDLLGRALLPGETVHHRDGNRSNNRTNGPLRQREGKWLSGNLELWNTSQPAGQHIGDKLTWAREILASYEDAATLDPGRGA